MTDNELPAEALEAMAKAADKLRNAPYKLEGGTIRFVIQDLLTALSPPAGQEAESEVCPTCEGDPTYHEVSARDGAVSYPECGGSGRAPA